MFGGRFSSSTGLVGIDLSTRSVKLLQVREQNGELSVIGAGRIDAPDHESADRMPWTGQAHQLKSIFGTGRFTGRRCAVSLPRVDVQFVSVRLPKMPEEELREAAAWEAAQRFKLDRNQMEADYIRTGASPQGGENREEVFVFAASHAAIEARLAPILEAGFRPVAIDVSVGALTRIFSRHARRDSDRDRVRTIIDVGCDGSTITIVRGNQIAFCKTIPIGGLVFNQAVAEHLQMDAPSAWELRRMRMLRAAGELESATLSAEATELAAAINPATERAVYEAVRPYISDLVKELTLCLRYYGVTFRGTPPERVILTGGDGREPMLRETLQSMTKLPTSFDDELETMSKMLPQIREHSAGDAGLSSSWSVAAGLSLRGVSSQREKPQDKGIASAAAHPARGVAA